MAARYGYTSHGHPVPTVIQVQEMRPKVARCGGPALCQVCSAEVAEMLARLDAKPQEPSGGPELAPHVSQALEASGSALVTVLAPWVGMVQERDEVLGRMTRDLVDLQHALGSVLLLARPSWAADVRTVEQAQALLSRLTPTTPKDDRGQDDHTP